ncbi:hypothetical protein DFP83_1225 [Idiomarina fontislapidosi]|uniref:Uncharacterized protein n=1 Tax=Idiomarina fontislapidosi TaxID=263723 RepID=A0A432XJU0_9GAMM|nr:hypothetical protein [Idiomarina fontislapidosi]PYE30219.1 hypothetical protein DFP83_1225 [Idiomarina fontislapidosi]RUO48896.1 hypothetical protein CWE25_13200 [Idiomarina fontislapidosi]
MNTSKNEQRLALTDLVRQLGYDDSTKLANAVRDILKGKESFEKYVDDDDHISSGNRPEKTLVSPDAKTLVDNLCLLRPYTKIFGKSKSESSEYAPFRSLKSKSDRPKLERKIQDHRKKFEMEILRSKQALNALPKFASLFLSEQKIDLEKDSLRTLLSECGEWNDYSNTYAESLWSDIVTLSAEVETSSDTSETRRQLGEKLLLIGDQDSALEHLHEAVSVYPENGLAHIALAVIYLDTFRQCKAELQQAASQNEFAGLIESPINSSEHNLNEQLLSQSNDYSEARERLLKHAIMGLYYWPGQTVDADKEVSFGFHYLSDCPDTSLDFNYSTLLTVMLNHIQEVDFERLPNEMNAILRLNFYSKRYDRWSVYLNSCKTEESKLILVLGWLSMDAVKQVIDEKIRFQHRSATISQSDYRYYQSQAFQQHYIQIYGLEAYRDFSVLTLKQAQTELTINNANQLASPVYLAAKDVINEATDIKAIDRDKMYDYDDSTPDCVYAWHETAECVVNDINGWKSLLEHRAWLDFGCTDHAPSTLCKLALVASLAELSLDIESPVNVVILLQLVENKTVLDTAVEGFSPDFFKYLEQGIFTNCKYGDHPAVKQALEKIITAIQEYQEE